MYILTTCYASNNNLEAINMKEKKKGLHFILNFSVSLLVLLTMWLMLAFFKDVLGQEDSSKVYLGKQSLGKQREELETRHW